MLALPIALEVNFVDEDNALQTRSSTSTGAGATLIINHYPIEEGCSRVEIAGVVDSVERTCVQETWKLSLCPEDQLLSLEVSGAWTSGQACDIETVVSIQRAVYLKQPSIYGLFDRGVTQMMECQNCTLQSGQKLKRLYTVGQGAALDLTRETPDGSDFTLLLSEGNGFESGFKEILVGELPDTNLKLEDQWRNNFTWAGADPISDILGSQWTTKWKLYPNNYDFPVYPLSLTARQTKDGIDFRDLRTAMMG